MQDPRSTVPAGKLTLRSQLMEAIIAQLKLATFEHGGNVGAGDAALFDFVERGVLDDITTERTPMATVEEGDETPDPKMYMHIDETFRVYVHFKVVKQVGLDPEPLVNYYFGRITQTLVTPEHFADIAFDITEAGNSIQYQGKSDPEPGGTIYYDVMYRHGLGNRFSETGNGE